MESQQLLRNLWWCGVDAVVGDRAVQRVLEDHSIDKPDTLIAVGKAACGMTMGAFKQFGPIDTTVVITKAGHADPRLDCFEPVQLIESAHPIPDERSLAAGRTLLQTVQDASPDTRLLMLVSGGASSLVEVLRDNMTLADLANMNRDLTTSGLSIEDINQERRKHSLIKGGKLLRAFKGKSVDTLFICDTRQADISTVGSGIGDSQHCSTDVATQVLCAATNTTARDAITCKAAALGIGVQCSDEALYADVPQLAQSLAKRWRDGPPGLYVHGGESTVSLPENAGVGGRNQHLGLTLARELADDSDIVAIVAGTDGTDGPTPYAGAMINGSTWQQDRNPAQYIERADSGSYLKDVGALFISGPTDTNVMDLVIALKR